ncbi:MAG: AgmX/PglI C-terminal domain-containing protein [Sandaracinaceae bacterium]
MKFLCPNCKAKYQISDEKIAGRTLKMDCRRCNHPIVIRGTVQPSSSSRPGNIHAGVDHASASQTGPSIASPSRRPGGSHVGQAPSRGSSRSALGSDFRRNAAAAPPAPQRPTALDQWHVAINEVPVGPMKREEVDKKMAAGAITGESLCWREGFDDWREVKKVPELAALLRRHQARPAPPPPRPAFPAPSRGLGGRPAPAAPASPRQTPRAPVAPTPAAARSTQQRPAAARANAPGSPIPGGSLPNNVVPIGGRLGASAAPAFDERVDDFMDEDPTRVGTALEFDELEAQLRADEPVTSQPVSGAVARGATPFTPDPEPEPVPTAEALPEEAFDPFASPARGPGSDAVAGSSPNLFAPAPAPSPAPAVVSQDAVPERRQRAIPIGAWIAIAGAMAFGVALAVMVGTHFLTQPTEVAVAPTPPTPDPTPDPTPSEPELDLPEEPTPEAPEATEETTAEPTADGETAAGGGRRGTTGTATRPAAPSGNGTGSTGGRALTDAERAALARAGADDSALPAPIRTTGTNLLDDRQRSGGASELTGDQVRTVVNNNRSRVQQCYEVEARRTGTAPSLRVNAAVTIGASGTVQSARATGGDFGNLQTCIERVVRQWTFPRSSGQTQTTIPFVFAGRDG